MLVSLLVIPMLRAQDTDGPKPDWARLPQTLGRDQAGLWTRPAHLESRDWRWLAPLAGTTALLLANDQRSARDYLHTNADARARSRTVARWSLVSLGSLPVYLAWRGWRQQDDYARDTAWLTGRAMAGAWIVSQALHVATRRAAPGRGAQSGRFLEAEPGRSSFPSDHAAAAWAAAGVLAARYPGWLTKAGVFGLASAVSVSRWTAGEHFPSEIVAGSALGFLVGHWMARPRGAQDLAKSALPESGGAPAGSVYVPMDSWIYGALDRLAAFGLVPSQVAGLRPWTRAECLRQAAEAESNLGAGGAPASVAPQARAWVQALLNELGAERASRVVLESVWLRAGALAGPVLNDSFHFGQTVRDDFGRPFGRGFNGNFGFGARAESGRWFAYGRGEYQQAPGTPAYALPVRQAIAQLDGIPLPDGTARASTGRFRPLEAYAGVRLGGLEFSLGKQSLYWGPTEGAPLSFSRNAEPTKNLRISTVEPLRLPGPLRYLGGVRAEFVIGKLGGHQYTWRPWFNAQKVSFKLTENLEMGFTRWSLFWGVGHPMTLGSLWRNFISTDSPTQGTDPGDRKGGFDFRWRIPGLRHWLTLYSDSYCDDDPSPLAAPRHAAISPGLYLSHVPGLPRLDLRVEAASTTPLGGDRGGTFLYYNSQYRAGNTNYGYLLGNPAGRDGRALEAWAGYWVSPRTRVQAGYRQFKGGSKFLPGGATQTDATLRTTMELAPGWHADVVVQYERFVAPLLGGPRRNRGAWVQLRWEPQLPLLH